MTGGKYKVIMADPPWPYNGWTKEGVPTRKLAARGMAPAHYPVMKIEAIAALPVADLAEKDSVLLLWATWPRLKEAIEVGEAWGFTYKTNAFLWAKLTPLSLRPDDVIETLKNWPRFFITSGEALKLFPRYHFGLGYWSRANTEPCLLFTKGHPKRINNDVAQLIVAPVGRHSAKPLETYGRIERLVEGPYLEMFARNKQPGWDSWGNEIESDITLEVRAS